MDNQSRRVKLVVAYDGTAYHGWQLQNNGNTIEGELNRALSNLLKEEVRVIGASRTDSGVHALGNIAVFDTSSPIPPEKICYALNARLPEDIRVMASCQVPGDWHPRKCVCRKTYEYRITRGAVQQPTRRLYAHHVYREMDVPAMARAASYLVGEHDFKSFCQAGSQAETTVRTLYEAAVLEEGSEVVIRVTGNGFLYNMVRIIAGTLLEVGFGRLEPKDIPEILEKKDRAASGPTAPARGLTLVKYEYPET